MQRTNYQTSNRCKQRCTTKGHNKQTLVFHIYLHIFTLVYDVSYIFHENLIGIGFTIITIIRSDRDCWLNPDLVCQDYDLDFTPSAAW